jgi:hypothetical protein
VIEFERQRGEQERERERERERDGGREKNPFWRTCSKDACERGTFGETLFIGTVCLLLTSPLSTQRLKEVYEPEAKRKIIGDLFLEVKVVLCVCVCVCVCVLFDVCISLGSLGSLPSARYT